MCLIAFLLQKNGSHIIDTAPLKMITYFCSFRKLFGKSV